LVGTEDGGQSPPYRNLPDENWDSARLGDVIGDDGAEQCMRADVVDGDGNYFADEARVAIEDDNAIVGRAAGELNDLALVFAAGLRAVASSFDEDLDALTEEALAVLFADSVLQLQQLVVAPILDLVGNVIGVELGTFGSGPLAVLKDEAVFEPTL